MLLGKQVSLLRGTEENINGKKNLKNSRLKNHKTVQ